MGLKNMIYGYARVSKKEQNLQLQIDALNKYGVDKIFKDKVSSTKLHRDQLDTLLSKLHPGDTLVVWKLDRLGRSLRQLLDLVDSFDKQDICFVSLNDMIDTKTPMGKFFYAVSAAFAQLERETISMRTIAGLEAARARGRVGGRPKKDRPSIDLAIKLYKKGFTLKEIKSTANITPNTMYKYLRHEVIDLYNQGESIEAIKQQTSCSRQIIEKWLDNFNR